MTNKKLLKEIKQELEAWNGERLYYVGRIGEPQIIDYEDGITFEYDELISKIEKELQE